MEDIRINLENLNDKEREQFMTLVEKANKPQSKVWKPKVEEVYWSVSVTGCVVCQFWCDDKMDNNLYLYGNCFRTKEEAEFYREKLLVTAELQRFADENNEHEIKWDISPKFFIYYRGEYGDLQIDYRSGWIHSDVWFSSREIAKKAIETIGADRIKKYYLGVEE